MYIKCSCRHNKGAKPRRTDPQGIGGLVATQRTVYQQGKPRSRHVPFSAGRQQVCIPSQRVRVQQTLLLFAKVATPLACNIPLFKYEHVLEIRVLGTFTKSFTSEGSNEVQFVYLIFTDEKKNPLIFRCCVNSPKSWINE